MSLLYISCPERGAQRAIFLGAVLEAEPGAPVRPVRLVRFGRSQSRPSRARSHRASGHAMSPVVRRGRGGRLRGRRRATATAIDSGPSRHRPRFVHAGSGSDCGSSSCRGAARGGGDPGTRAPPDIDRPKTTDAPARARLEVSWRVGISVCEVYNVYQVREKNRTDYSRG